MRLSGSLPAEKTEDRRSFLGISSAATLSMLTGGLSDQLSAATNNPPPTRPMYDCIVLGLGAMGSACLYQLAKRGANVLGLEQFDIAHALESSGGISRQTKVMPYLGSHYEPLIRRANHNWKSLESDSGQNVFHNCGYLQLGTNQAVPRDSGDTVELLEGSTLIDQFPQFQNLPDNTNGLLDQQGGLLRSELAIAAHCSVALQRGAHVRAQEPVVDWVADPSGVIVTTQQGKYRAKHLVVAAGAWNSHLVPRLQNKLKVTRLSLAWFAPDDAASLSVENFPIWLHGPYYGFPVLPDFPGFKVAKHWYGDPTAPTNINRTPNDTDRNMVRDYLSQHLPSANGNLLACKVCMYTHGGPWLGPLPGEQRVTIIAACNGGGFKFSTAYGEALADFATNGKTDLPVEFMAPDSI